MNIIEQKNTNVNHLSKKIRNGSLVSFRAFSSAKLSVCITMRNRFKYREKGRSDYGLNERCSISIKGGFNNVTVIIKLWQLEGQSD